MRKLILRLRVWWLERQLHICHIHKTSLNNIHACDKCIDERRAQAKLKRLRKEWVYRDLQDELKSK